MTNIILSLSLLGSAACEMSYEEEEGVENPSPNGSEPGEGSPEPGDPNTPNDECAFANNDVCDEGVACPSGTDTTDCSRYPLPSEPCGGTCTGNEVCNADSVCEVLPNTLSYQVLTVSNSAPARVVTIEDKGTFSEYVNCNYDEATNELIIAGKVGTDFLVVITTLEFTSATEFVAGETELFEYNKDGVEYGMDEWDPEAASIDIQGSYKAGTSDYDFDVWKLMATKLHLGSDTSNSTFYTVMPMVGGLKCNDNVE